MKIVDADVTLSDRSPIDVSADAETCASPGLRPEVLADAAQRQTKAMVHAALFKATGEASTIGPYQVLKLLGEGGMGVVYAAYDDKLERKVALKLIRGAVLRRPEGRARTLREARALARLSHPNVVHVYQVGEVDDEIYVAMEFLTGSTLRAWLAARPRTWREVLVVLRQAGEGLAAAHRQGVIHRDFKPANVIVGDDGRVRVLDFGLAHFFGADGEDGEARPLAPAGEVTDVLLTQTGAVLGTPAYMAAEQFAGGRGDAKTDQFSFCTALYEALYGQRPFAGDQHDALAAAVQGGRVHVVKARTDVPQWLHRVVVRGLQPDPAARWPAMDALLAALQPPEARVRWGRIAGASAAAGALLIGGVGYVYMLESPPRPPALGADVGAAARQAEAIGSQDRNSLTLARSALTSDPLQTIRALSMLAGDDAWTWQRARFLAAAAEARGLPATVLRADDGPLESVHPLPGGGLLGRDASGAVWRWSLSEKPGNQTLPPGSATELVVARDVPVWAAVASRAVRVFGADREQTIATGELIYADWRLAADGGTLIASAHASQGAGGWQRTLTLWDLTRPGAPPRTIALAPETTALFADDATVVLAREARGIRVIRTGEAGGEKLLKYRGQPLALSADGRFVVARPADADGKMDVLELKTGKSRRVEAESVVVLAGADVLFTRMEYGRPLVRRESLATGAVAWRLPLPNHPGQAERRLVVDAAHEQFAAAIDEWWGVGDLRTGALTSYVTVPKDSALEWVGAGELMAVVDNQVRIYRPATTPVQVRHTGLGCALAPGGRWAVVEAFAPGEYTRVELATRATTTFRCPAPPPTGRADHERRAGLTTIIDDDGQVAMFASDGWSCWWDEQHGARAGAQTGPFDAVVGLPRGTALAAGAEVEVWSGPDERAQRWTAAGPLVALEASPSGALLAARSEQGVQVLHVDSGVMTTVPTWTAPRGRAEVLASALAWSPDGGRLAVLDKVDAALELSVWDVVGEPREVGPANSVTLGGHVLQDSPGLPRNRITFTPAGTSVALTSRHETLLLVDLATHEARRLEAPALFDLHMRSETEAIAIDQQYVPFMIDFASSSVTPLTADPELGGMTRPMLRPGANGSLWTCGALGSGMLVEVGASEPSSQHELRGRLLDRAASL